MIAVSVVCLGRWHFAKAWVSSESIRQFCWVAASNSVFGHIRCVLQKMWISLVFIYIFADLLRFLEVKATATTQKRWNYIIEHASTFEIVYIYIIMTPFLNQSLQGCYKLCFQPGFAVGAFPPRPRKSRGLWFTGVLSTTYSVEWSSRHASMGISVS